ncbi:hypothetical protein FGB62_165g021 [Gracilaria domingensis]|nr:hypothetical protein FGB62_165g021 [Gracilaria domingensis]
MRVHHACFMLVSNSCDEVRNEVLNALFDFVRRTFPSTVAAEDGVNPNTAFREIFFGLLNVVVQTPLLLAPLSRSLVPSTDAFPPLKEAWFKSQALNWVDEDAHELTMKFFEVLPKLGTTHFARSFLGCNCHLKELSNNDRELSAAFVDLMAAELSCPSYVLIETVYNFFTSMTGHISKKQLRCVLASFLVTFLYAATAGVLKFSFYPDVELYKEVDYGGDDISFRVARRKLNGLMYGALRAVAQILPEPTPCARYISTAGPREVGIVCPDSTSQSWNFGDFVRDKRAWRYCIDTICPALDSMCHIASDKVSADVKTQITALQRQAFEVIIAWNEVDMVVPKIHVLRVLFLLYSTDPSKLDTCIETLGSLIDNNICQRLCRSKDAHVGRFANMLCDYAVSTLLNPKFHEQDKLQLMEASVSYVMSIPDVKEAEHKIERMLMPLVNKLSSAMALSVHQSPKTFLEFLVKGPEEDVSPILCAFCVLSEQQAPNISPYSQALQSRSHYCMMLSTLHGFFNPARFRRDNTDKLRRNVLLPTCKYLVHVVNLDNPDVLKRVADEHDSYEERQAAFREGPTVQEQRCYGILCSYGIDQPDSQFAWIRETLNSLRTSGYEIVHFGRSWLRRAAVNLITGIYPSARDRKDSSGAQVEEYFPPQFQVPVIGDALSALWITARSPGHDANDKSSFRYSFSTVSLDAEVPPRSSFQFFGPLLEISFGAAVLTVGNGQLKADPNYTPLSGKMESCRDELHKQLLRDLVNRIADHEGTVTRRETKVNVLPEKLEAINTKRRARLERGDLDELELEDVALDSLFDEGDTL